MFDLWFYFALTTALLVYIAICCLANIDFGTSLVLDELSVANEQEIPE